ncbi:HAMP domain [Rhabdaerophilaceae bacterium]
MIEQHTRHPAEQQTGFRYAIASSLALRWALVVTLLAGLGLTLMVHVVGRALRAKIDAESAHLTAIATQKMAERIGVEAQLADRSLHQLVQRYASELHSIARQPETMRSVLDRDDQQVTRRLQHALRLAGFDGGILLNARLQVLGSHNPNSGLVASELALRQLPSFGALQALIANNDPLAPSHFRFSGLLDIGFAQVFQEKVEDRYGFVMGTPVFDDYGDVAGLLMAYRLIRISEPIFESLARDIGADLALVTKDRIVSRSGAVPETISVQDAEDGQLLAIENASKIYRCVNSLAMTRLCIFRDSATVTQFRDELQVLSATETDNMQMRLALFSAGLASLMGWLIMSLTRRLTGPLTDIATEVDRVASGDFTTRVRHVDREDEVGRIARAIESMQYALIERDRMRMEMVRIDAINQRRLLMGSAIGRFESGMSDVMHKISDAAKALQNAGSVMGKAARSAEEQADLIHATTIATAAEASAANGATALLSRGIMEINERLRSARAIVDSGDAQAREARDDIEQIARLALEAEDALSQIQRQVADMASDVLKASLQAVRPENSESGVAGAARGLVGLTENAALATARMSEAITNVSAVAEAASSRLAILRQGFGQAQRDTAEIALVVAEQDAARRAISDGLAGAALAMSNLNEAVEGLRRSMSSAQRATDDIIDVARSILSDSQAIDTSLRSFVREVAA